jgi:hypothetical protein
MPKTDENVIAELRGIANKVGSTQPASAILKNLDQAALISKLVKPGRDRGTFRPTDENAEIGMINTGIEQISKVVMARVEDNENIFKLFPDIELAVQIVVSSVLSPKDMVGHELIYRTATSVLPSQVTAKLVEYVHAEVDGEYKLKDDLQTILRDALFKTGSHVRLTLPESAVDELINSTKVISTESIYSSDIFSRRQDGFSLRNLGFLGDTHEPENKSQFALESMFSSAARETYNGALHIGMTHKSEIVEFDKLKELLSKSIEVSDNYHALKLPRLIEKATQQQVERLTPSALHSISVSAMESYYQFQEQKKEGKATPGEIGSMVYKSGKADYKPFVRIPTPLNLKRKSVGRPLVMTIPSEAAIPVHVPGNPSEHIGYFIPSDVDGNPVTVDSVGYDSGGGLSSILQSDRSNSTTASLLTEKAKRNLGSDSYVPIIDHISELYANIIEADLLERLSKGVYSRKLTVGRNNEIYRIMLARTLSGQYTRLIYIPADYVTYFAFNFHRNGVGKSYLDDLSNITSLRAMVLFSKVMAKVKSSITTTLATIKLDERDRDPVKTIEMAKHLVAKARQQYFPHGLNRVVDLTDWIQRAGIEFAFENHPGLPTTSFNFESKNIQHTMPDDDLDEMLRYQQYMHLGLSPETVDSAAKAEFATTIEQNSILFARRITSLSNIFSKDLTDFVQKLIKHDQEILKGLMKIILENKGEIESVLGDEEREFMAANPNGFIGYVLEIFIDSLEVDLPKPESTRNASQKAALEQYEEALDKSLEYIFSADVVPSDLAGESSQYVDTIKVAWKAALMRKWMAENNYTPEAFDITDIAEDGKPMADLLTTVTSYNKNVMLNIAGFLKKMQGAKAASDKDLAAIGAQPSGGGDSGGSDEGGSDEFSDGGAFGGGEGSDEMGEGNPFDEAGEALGETAPAAEGEENPEESGEAPSGSDTMTGKTPFG